MVAGPNAVKYIEGLEKTSDSISSSLYEGYEKQEQEKWNDAAGSESASTRWFSRIAMYSISGVMMPRRA